MAERRRFFTPRQTTQTKKKVIVGIDFGTSYSKVYYNAEGNKQPIKFSREGKESYFLPSLLFYSSSENKLYYKRQIGTQRVEYFKYSMIYDNLLSNSDLKNNNSNMNPRPELLCSVFFLANLITEVKEKISTELKTTEIDFSFNMGCPIDNFNDKNLGVYDKALSLAYSLSEVMTTEEITVNKLKDFYNQEKDKRYPNLQTVPELYAEALWFIEQSSSGEGLYSILDIGGGSIDFATIQVSRSVDGQKSTSIYSQNVMPLGIEILLQYMYPDDYKTKRMECLEELKTQRVSMPHGWTAEDKKDRRISKAIEFDTIFSQEIMNVRERNRHLMDEQNTIRKMLPYYTFGGGANFRWYHSIIKQHTYAFDHASIPPLTRQEIQLNGIPHNRLIIAEQLTRSSFPEIDGFPWHFSYIPPKDYYDDSRFEMEDRQREIYGDD